VYFGPTLHRLRISLNDVEPEVWRSVVVASDTLLPRLARILETVMGWEGYHLHQFVVGDIVFGVADEDMADYLIDHEQVALRHIAPRPTELEWHYDFGDGWVHRVVVESVGEPDPVHDPPVCLDGARACPPEDCGGPGGYARLLEVLADPDHGEHGFLLEWVGGAFDPEAFDLEGVNQRLRFLRDPRSPGRNRPR
jgi:hypothetical protein